MKTDWSNYTITYNGTDYGVHYRDGINLVACETYVPNSPTPASPATIKNTGDLVTSADDDWNTPIQYGKTAWVGTAPSALGADCYRVPICVSGLNLVDKTTFTDNKYIAYDTGVVVHGTGTTFITAFTPVLPNKTIYWKNNSTSQVSGIAFYTSAKVYISGVQSISGGAITTPANARYFRVTFYYAAASYDTAMISYGSSAPSAYEPYRVPLTYNIYLDAPLRTSDTLDETGLLTRNSAKVILDGVTYGKMFTDYWGDTLTEYNRGKITGIASTAYLLEDAACTHFEYQTSVNSNYADDVGFMATGDGIYIRFGSGSSITTVTAANSWLVSQLSGDTPVICIYTLATPTTESLTMPAQIDTFAGTTIIQLDTTTQPAILEAEYLATKELPSE